MNPKEFREKLKELLPHILSTYFTLRIGMGVIAIAFPISLWLVGLLRVPTVELQTSMSAYYHTSMRDVFVGILFAIGTFLYLYKGFSRGENIALNFAGVFALGVALFPEGDKLITIHGVCAVLLFVCIAYVCIFEASETLDLMNDKELAARYSRFYKILGLAMIILPLTAFLLLSILGKNQHAIFFVEAAAVWVFGTFWITKGREIHATQIDNRILRSS